MARNHDIDPRSWIAVDEVGTIAVLEPGSRGRIPKGAPRVFGDADDTALVLLALRLVRALDVLSPEEPIRPDALASDRLLVMMRGAGETMAGYRAPTRGPDDVRTLLATAAPRTLRESPLVVLTDEEVDVPTLIALARRDDVAHIIGWRDLDRTGVPGSLHRLVHRETAADPGTYLLVDAPERPIVEDDLPADAREALCRVRLPLRFGDSDSIVVGPDVRATPRPPSAPGEALAVKGRGRPAPRVPTWLLVGFAVWIVLAILRVMSR
jgi:hypothetical protein